jgi:hypothetical protein
LLKGIRAIMWNRCQDGERHFRLADEKKAKIDFVLLQKLNHKLLDYAAEYGIVAMQQILDDLMPYIEEFGGRQSVRKLRGLNAVNQAFQCYQASKYAEVPGQVIHAIFNDPKYLLDRGVLSVLSRSFVRS